jgi:hypothetical protein
MRFFWLYLLLLFSSSVQSQLSEQSFKRPDNGYSTRVDWLWSFGRVSDAAFNSDLEVLTAVGIGRGVLVVQGSDADPIRRQAGLEQMNRLFQQAARLDMSFSVYDAADGGFRPKVEHSAKKLIWSEMQTKGGTLSISLKKPTTEQAYYRDIACLACENKTSTVIDLTPTVDSLGKCIGKLPSGEWTVYRFGYTLDDAAEPNGSRFDKFDPKAVGPFIDTYLKGMSEWAKTLNSSSFEGLVLNAADIRERTWTANLLTEFQRRSSFDWKKTMVALAAPTSDSTEQTRKYRTEFCRVLTELSEEYYVKAVRSFAGNARLNVRFGFSGGLNRLEPTSLKAASDSWWIKTPDRLLSLVFSDSTEVQNAPLENPVRAFHRDDPFFHRSFEFNEYVRRCQYMIRQGFEVADIAVLSQDEKHVGKGIRTLTDLQLTQDLFVKDRRLYLPDGSNFACLIVPPDRIISLPLLRSLKTLLSNGASVSASKPNGWTGVLTPVEQREWSSLVQEIWNELPSGVYRYGAGKIHIDQSQAALLQAYGHDPDFSYTSVHPDASVCYQHRRMLVQDVWFVSNVRPVADTIMASFRISDRQPSFWHPMTGEIHVSDMYRRQEGRTLIPMVLQPFESVFVVFGKGTAKTVYDGLTKDGFFLMSANPDLYPENLPAGIRSVSGSDTIPMPELMEMQGKCFFRKKGRYERITPGIPNKEHPLLVLTKSLPVFDLMDKGFAVLDSIQPETNASGNDTLVRRFLLSPKELLVDAWVLVVDCPDRIVEVTLNDHYAGRCWLPPYRMDVTRLLKTGENRLELRFSPRTDLRSEKSTLGKTTLSAWKVFP